MWSISKIFMLIISFENCSIQSMFQTKKHYSISSSIYSSSTLNIDTNIKDNLRAIEMNKYLKRTKRRNEMPLSQSWYKHRQQFISKNQKRSYNLLWPKYGIHLFYNTTINNRDIFQKDENDLDVYTILDIGFGNGDSIVGMAKNNSKYNYIGCEIHKAGISSTLLMINESNIDNIRLIRSDVTVLFESHLLSKSLNEICVFFPDPWPNSIRDSERRVIRPYMLQLFASKLKDNGILHITTDVEDYANYIEDVILQFNQNHNNIVTNNITIQDNYITNNSIYNNDPNNNNNSTNIVISNDLDINNNINNNKANSSLYYELINKSIHEATLNGPDWRPITKYEKKASIEGRSIYEYSYRIIIHQ